MRFLILPAVMAALALQGCAALTTATDQTKTQAERIAAALEAGAQAFCAASLTVRDAVSSSAPDAMRVVVSAVNAPPLAVISSLSRVNVGSVVQLSGLASTDVNGDALTFKWALLNKPLLANGSTANSVAALSSLTANNPVFTADLPGVYVVSLVVNDGKVNSDPVTVAITAIDTNDATGLTGLTGN
jgi:hypothetical protein